MTSFIQLLAFFFITIIYFWVFKTKMAVPPDNPDLSTIEENYKKYHSDNLFGLIFYFISVLIVEVVFNVIAVSQMCGGSITDNIGAGFLLAFIPWFLLFGAVIIMLLSFPGLKTVFSNVIGYFCISWKAHDLLSSILIDEKMESVYSKNGVSTNETGIRETASAILKICSNKSLLINEFNPINFSNLWTILKPLVKSDQYNEDTKQKLFDIVLQKDNIGEMMWYFYTAIFLTSVVGYNTVVRGCSKSLTAMKQSSSDYNAQAEAISKKNASVNQVY